MILKKEYHTMQTFNSISLKELKEFVRNNFLNLCVHNIMKYANSKHLKKAKKAFVKNYDIKTFYKKDATYKLVAIVCTIFEKETKERYKALSLELR